MPAVVVSSRTKANAVGSVALVSGHDPWRIALGRVLDSEGFVVAVDSGIVPDVLAGVDVVLLDLRIWARRPDALVTEVRAATAVPLLALGDGPQELESVAALNAGADSYARLGAPPREIVSRVRALRRRSPVLTQAAVDGNEIDTLPELVIDLREPELAVFHALVGAPRRVVTRSDLELVHKRAGGEATSLDLVVRRIRDRIERVDGERRIVVVRGLGFRYDPE